MCNRKKMHPAADVAGDDFMSRDHAYKELAKVGRLAKAVLTRALEHRPSSSLSGASRICCSSWSASRATQIGV
jgi:hypothetical protein